jgi:hypothetical protein
MTKFLSPAAQVVLDAFTEDSSLHDWKHNHWNTEALTAALRVAAKGLQSDPSSSSPLGALLSCQDQLYAIAAELEGHQ